MTSSGKSILFVLRHAHAVSSAAGSRDYERGLDERGRREAEQIRRHIAAEGYAPERIACSGAVRTRETLAAVGLGKAPADFTDDLYSGTVEAYLAHARAFGDAGSGMLVGHNPMITEFVRLLAGSGDADAMERLAEGFPTGTLAVLETDGPLSRIDAGGLSLSALVSPRD